MFINFANGLVHPSGKSPKKSDQLLVYLLGVATMGFFGQRERLIDKQKHRRDYIGTERS
jgi:hypothetical protein